MLFEAKFKDTSQQFVTDFGDDTSKQFVSDFGAVHIVTEYIGGEPYDGEYTVTPKVEAQTLHTKQRILNDDMTVLAIPYAEVTNSSNGKTVSIG